MSEEPTSLVLEHLRHIRGVVDRTDERLSELTIRVGRLELNLAQIQVNLAEQSVRLDRLDNRLARLEKRFDLVDQ